MSTPDESNGNAAHLATLAEHQRKFWRLAVVVTIVAVAALFYFVYLGSARAADLRQRDETIVRLEAERQALLDERATLTANLDALKAHTLTLTAIIETLTGGEALNPHAGLDPSTPNPHGG